MKQVTNSIIHKYGFLGRMYNYNSSKNSKDLMIFYNGKKYMTVFSSDSIEGDNYVRRFVQYVNPSSNDYYITCNIPNELIFI